MMVYEFPAPFKPPMKSERNILNFVDTVGLKFSNELNVNEIEDEKNNTIFGRKT
jgi:hypothetical protein